MEFWTVLAILVIILFCQIVQSFFPSFLSPENCAILITGCDTGFGHELAIQAHKFGFYVFAACFSKSSDGATTLQKEGCEVLEMDVTKQETIDASCNHIDEYLKGKGLRLHGIVNNAGVNINSGPVEWSTPEMIEKVFNVNTLGVVRVTRTFLPFIRAAKGRIVNVCSIAAHIVPPDMVPYCMSKSATFFFSNGLRRELKLLGVKVSSISPWFYKTPIIENVNLKQYSQNSWDGATPEVRLAYGAGNLSFEEYYLKSEKMANRNSTYVRTNTSEVIDCMMDALINENPKADYIPDIRSRILSTICEILPIYWVDKMVHVSKRTAI